jgi:hypothetical protein
MEYERDRKLRETKVRYEKNFDNELKLDPTGM